MTEGPNRSRPRAGAVSGIGAKVIALTGARLVSVVAGFATSVLGARLIGADGMGAAGVAFTVGTVAALVTGGGLGQASIYFLNVAVSDPARVAGRFLVLGVSSAALGGLVGLAFLIVFGGALAMPPTTWLPTAGLAVAIVMFELAGSFLLGIHAARAYVGTQLLEATSTLAFSAILLVGVSRSAESFIVAAATAYAVAASGAIASAHRALGGLRAGIDAALTRAALAFGLRGQVGNVLQFLNLRLDLLLVSALLDLRLAGLYFVAVRVSEVVVVVANSAGSFLFPEVAAQGDGRATAVTERLVRATLLAVAAGAIVTVIGAEIVLVVAFGAGFAEGVGALRITALAMLPLAMFRVLSGDLKGRGRPGLVSISAAAAVGVTVVADLVLIPLAGIEGAATASVLAYATGSAILVRAYLGVTDGSLRALVPGPADVLTMVSAARRFAGRRGGVGALPVSSGDRS